MQVMVSMSGMNKLVNLADDLMRRGTDLRPPLRDFGEMMRRKISKRLSGTVLKRRTGRLEGSLDVQVARRAVQISAGGGKGGAGAVRYASVHHHGGTIRPKNKKWLTIPFPGGPADTSAGKVMMRARDFKGTFVAKGMIFQKVGKDGIRPLFILKKKVDMPKRPYMYAEDGDIEYLKESVLSYLKGAW